MKRWNKAAAIIFLASSAVYAGEAIPATSATAGTGDNGAAAVTAPSNPESTGLTDNNAAPATEPATTADAPATADTPATPATEPAASQPSPEVQTLTKSQVNITDAGTVELHVNDANIVEVLKMLSVQSQRNIVASKEVHGTLTANLYDVTVPEALDAILHANGYAYREKGNFIYVYSAKEMAEIEKSERVMRTVIYRLSYSPAANVVTMIKPVLSAQGQVSFTTAAITGIGSTPADAGGNSHSTEDMIVVTDYQENLDQAKKLIEEIDKRPQEVLIEATILAATLNEDNQLGVDFNVLGGVNFDTVLSNAGGQIVGGQINGTSAAAGGTAGGSGGAAGGSGGSGSGGSSGTALNTVNASPTLGSLGTGNTFTGSQPNGFKIGVLGNNMSVFISALEGVTNTTVLANPKILALNKQKGEVKIGSSDGYHTTTVTETSTVQAVQLFDTGTHLIFRPFIGSDGYIRMEIHPEDSTGGVTGDLPHKTTTELTTNIMVKDGHTIVIGGLFREASQVTKSQVPGLGNIPGLGYLFRSQHDTTTRQEIIVLLTPHIIKDDEGYSKESLEALKEGEKLRIGVREGMMPFGRERLAESDYEVAVDEMNKPNPDRSKALWHLNSAINLNPQFMEAQKMKEEMTGQELRSVDNSTVHSFVKRRIIAERDLTAPQHPTSIELPPPPKHGGDTSKTLDAARASGKDIRKAAEEPHATAVTELPATDEKSEKATASNEKSGTPEKLAPVADKSTPDTPAAVADKSDASADKSNAAADKSDAVAEKSNAVAEKRPTVQPAKIDKTAPLEGGADKPDAVAEKSNTTPDKSNSATEKTDVSDKSAVADKTDSTDGKRDALADKSVTTDETDGRANKSDATPEKPVAANQPSAADKQAEAVKKAAGTSDNLPGTQPAITELSPAEIAPK